MTKEDKELLLRDLCARLPYGVCVHIRYKEGEPCYGKLTPRDIQWFIDSKIEVIKPYLRPMLSMTEEEKKEMLAIFEKPCENPRMEVDEYCCITYTKYAESHRVIDMYYDAEQQAEWLDWLNKRHFDYRGLIEKGLALEVPEGMYK